MPPSSARRVGAYGKLLANYAADDAVMDAGEAAELLFVRGIAFCSTSDSDGYMTEEQVRRYVGAGMRDAKRRAERLVEVGLWLRVEGGYVARSHTKIHETAEEKGYKLKTDRERKRAASGPKPPPPPDGFQTDSDRNPSGVREQAELDSLSLTVHNRTETEQGRDSETESDPPTEFCSLHPDGTDEPCGACAGRRRRRETWLSERAQRHATEKAQLAEARKACTECNPAGWIEDGDGQPLRRCGHARAAPALSGVGGPGNPSERGAE